MASTTVPFGADEIQTRRRPGVSEYQHRRRNLLGALVGAPVAAAVPATAAEAEDPHVEWERQVTAVAAEMRAIPRGEGPAYDALWKEWIGLQDQICLTAARTPAGIAAQVRLALTTTEEWSTLSDNEVEGLRNAVRSLQQLAGGV